MRLNEKGFLKITPTLIFLDCSLSFNKTNTYATVRPGGQSISSVAAKYAA
jgi:hypothetical protein